MLPYCTLGAVRNARLSPLLSVSCRRPGDQARARVAEQGRGRGTPQGLFRQAQENMLSRRSTWAGATMLSLFGLGALMSAVVLDGADESEGGAADKDAYRMKVASGGDSAYLPGANPGRRVSAGNMAAQGASVTPLLRSKVEAAQPDGLAPQNSQASAGGVTNAKDTQKPLPKQQQRRPALETGADISISAKPKTGLPSFRLLCRRHLSPIANFPTVITQ